MKRIYFCFIIVAALVFTACNRPGVDELIPTPTPNGTSGTPSPTADSIAGQVLETLSQPEWENRIIGTSGNVKAGEYLAGMLESFGYAPYKSDSLLMPYEQPGFDIERFFVDHQNSFTAYNIVGVIRGADSSKAWVLSAHFDGLNFDENATAAYDNASGCAALADAAARLAEHAKESPFERDIIICFFNGEEIGLFGSRAFVEETGYDYDEITNINIDCVGGIDCEPLIFQLLDEWLEGWDDNNAVLYDMMRDMLDKYGIEHTTGFFHGGSDHMSFIFPHMTAVSLIQEGALDLAHGHRDVINNVDLSEIEKISDVVFQFVTVHDGRSFLIDDLISAAA